MSNIQYKIPNDNFGNYLIGKWKRNLEWREFGGSFEQLRTSNNVIVIEEEKNVLSQPDSRFLNWKFGKTLEIQDLKIGLCMELIKDEDGTNMEWNYSDCLCHGWYQNSISLATLHFKLKNGSITASYRVVDADTMNVCIIECDNSNIPTIQYGYMSRL